MVVLELHSLSGKRPPTGKKCRGGFTFLIRLNHTEQLREARMGRKVSLVHAPHGGSKASSGSAMHLAG